MQESIPIPLVRSQCWWHQYGSGGEDMGMWEKEKIAFKFSKFQNYPMQAQLNKFLLRAAQEGWWGERESGEAGRVGLGVLSSEQLLQLIHQTLNSSQNYRDGRKLSLSSEETSPHSPLKCNCKKSKCLKLYCECFARGSFCRDCNCDCCQNTAEFSEVRARAIDEMVLKASLHSGFKSMSAKGCNCKKTGCRKKYCECFSLGVDCNQHCKCSNCENCA